jgi:RND family efflux transporter MFP subunit
MQVHSGGNGGWLGGLAALCGLSIAFAGCGHGTLAESAAPASKPELPVVKAAVLTVGYRPWPDIVRTQGSLIADEATVVGAKVAGRIADIDVDLGDIVRADEPLAMLEQEEFKLQISLAEAQLLQARAALGLRPTDLVEQLDPLSSPPVREAKAVLDETRTRIERVRQLRLRNAVTQEEFDTAVSAEAVAEARYGSAINGVRERIAQIAVQAAELSLAQQHLQDTVVRAPFDGLVEERHVARGSFVQVGSQIVTLVRVGKLRFRGAMPERHAHRLALDQQLVLRIEGVEQPRRVKVTRISPSVDETSRSLVFEAEVENADGSLRTGLFAEAEVIVDPEARALVVPKSAITEFAGSEKVWKVVDGVAKEQIVETVHRGTDQIEIVHGLAEGDQILARAGEGRVARIEPIFEEMAFTSTSISDSTNPPGSAQEAESSPAGNGAAER